MCESLLNIEERSYLKGGDLAESGRQIRSIAFRNKHSLFILYRIGEQENSSPSSDITSALLRYNIPM